MLLGIYLERKSLLELDESNLSLDRYLTRMSFQQRHCSKLIRISCGLHTTRYILSLNKLLVYNHHQSMEEEELEKEGVGYQLLVT